MAGLKNKANGHQVQDGAILDRHVNAAAGIQESKLAMNYPTASLFASSLQLIAPGTTQTVDDTTTISFPYIYLRDTANGKTYKLFLQNGTIVTQEV